MATEATELGSTTPDSSQLLSSSQAARRLGIHRSSLHLAVKQRLITPDLVTPGGHHRFFIETVDTFASRVATRSVTSQSPFIEKVSHAIADPDDVQAGVLESLREIKQAIPDIFLLSVMESNPHVHPLPPSRLLAELSDPPDVIAEFLQKYPSTETVSNRVLYSHEEVVANNLTHHLWREEGSALMARMMGVLSGAVLPLLVEGVAHGTVGLGSRVADTFTGGTMVTLREIANELAVLLAHKHGVDAQRSFTLAAGELVQAIDAPDVGQMVEEGAIEKLTYAFKIAQMAEEVFARGGGLPEMPLSPIAQELGELVSATEPFISIERDDEAGTLRGLAIQTTLCQPSLTVGALWRRDTPLTSVHEAALYTFAGLCALQARH